MFSPAVSKEAVLGWFLLVLQPLVTSFPTSTQGAINRSREKTSFPTEVVQGRRGADEHDSKRGLMECITSQRVCDPHSLLKDFEKKVIEKTIGGICLDSACACRRGCPTACPGVTSRVLVYQNRRSLTESHTNINTGVTNFLSHGLQLKLRPCLLDVLIVTSVHNGTLHSATFTTHQLLTTACIDHVALKTRHLLQNGEIALLITYQLQLYRYILLGEYHDCGTDSKKMKTDVKIAIVYACTLTPLMGCVIVVFLVFRARPNWGRNSSYAAYRKSLIGEDTQPFFTSK